MSNDKSIISFLAAGLVEDFAKKYPIRFARLSELDREWMRKKAILAMWQAKEEAMADFSKMLGHKE